MRYLSRENYFVWLKGLTPDYEVFVPVKKGQQRIFQRYHPSVDRAADQVVIGEARTTEPLKGFFTPAREKVAELFNPEIPPSEHKPFAIVGVKACDLQGFLIQDEVFLKRGNRDPFYARAREENLIISSDCTLALETCFCLALGHDPHPKGNFDINLSEVAGGFIVEVGSPKGRELVDDHESLFQAVPHTLLEERKEIRERVIAEVQSRIDEHGVPHRDQYQGMINRNHESKLWQEEAGTCVECGACNFICPTCHCFVLSDQQTGSGTARFRLWDSCMVKDFARVAGGGNPRPQLWMRLRNRFEKKLDFFPRVTGLYACTGCGRCIPACPADIDIRRVLKALVHNA